MVNSADRDSVVIVVGNPKPNSRTLEAAELVASQLFGTVTTTIDAVELGPALLTGGTDTVSNAVQTIREARWLVVASPTYKATYSGVLKCLLDQIPGRGLVGVTAFPVMVGAGPHHALAPEVFLRPVLTELGASCPMRGLYLLESSYREQTTTLSAWLEDAHELIAQQAPPPHTT